MPKEDIIKHLDPDMFQCSICKKWGPINMFISSPEQTKARSKCNVCEYGNITMQEWLKKGISNMQQQLHELEKRESN